MKKILVISNMYPSAKDPYYGTFVQEFYNFIVSNTDWDISLIAIRGRKKNIVSKVIAYLQFYFKILIRLSFFHYDLIYTHTISHPTPPLRIISFFKKLKTVYNIHGDDLLTTTKLAQRLLDFSAPLLKEAIFIVVPTSYFKDVLLQQMPWLQNQRIIISPSGGLSKKFYTDVIVDNPIPIIGYVSRIDSGKGWDIFIQALAILRDREIVFHAEMYGRGDEEADLLENIEKHGLGVNVKFLGPRSHEELPNIYKRFDVFVFPTMRKAESLGLVGLEAMAAGVPVIGSNIGGLKSYIRDSVNGFLFHVGDSIDLANKIQSYLQLSDSEKLVIKNSAYNTALNYESSIVNKELVKVLEPFVS